MIKDTTTNQKQKSIFIERTFNLSLPTVWKAWTEPESLKKWWGPEGYDCPSCALDFKVGGKYLASMKGPDGKEIWSTGIYKEIEPGKKIVMTDSFADNKGQIVHASFYQMAGEWDMEALVTLEFEEKDGKTIMKLQHKGLPVEMGDDCIKGWQSSFDKMENAFIIKSPEK